MPETEVQEVQKAPFPLLECSTCWGHGFLRGPLSDAQCPNRRCKAGKLWAAYQSEFHWPLDLQYDIVRIQQYKQWKAELFADMQAQIEAQRAEREVATT